MTALAYAGCLLAGVVLGLFVGARGWRAGGRHRADAALAPSYRGVVLAAVEETATEPLGILAGELERTDRLIEVLRLGGAPPPPGDDLAERLACLRDFVRRP